MLTTPLMRGRAQSRDFWHSVCTLLLVAMQWRCAWQSPRLGSRLHCCWARGATRSALARKHSHAPFALRGARQARVDTSLFALMRQFEKGRSHMALVVDAVRPRPRSRPSLCARKLGREGGGRGDDASACSYGILPKVVETDAGGKVLGSSSDTTAAFAPFLHRQSHAVDAPFWGGRRTVANERILGPLRQGTPCCCMGEQRTVSRIRTGPGPSGCHGSCTRLTCARTLCRLGRLSASSRWRTSSKSCCRYPLRS